MMSDEVIKELSLLSITHDVFLVLIDSAFAFDLPKVSAGWIEISDVETGQARTVSRRQYAQLADRAREWQDERAARRRRNSTWTSSSSGWIRRNRISPSVNSSSNDACGKPMSKRLLLTGFLCLSASRRFAGAQPAPTRETGTRNVEVDPIRCWWRTSAGAVRIGEQFDVSLTCAVLESEAVSVVVDESRLGNAVVQMAPFEVVSGSHPADLHAGIRRFFQYDYRLRIINPDVIGTDVRIPDIAMHYRVNSKVAANAAVQGRDLLYYLPPPGHPGRRRWFRTVPPTSATRPGRASRRSMRSTSAPASSTSSASP